MVEGKDPAAQVENNTGNKTLEEIKSEIDRLNKLILPGIDEQTKTKLEEAIKLLEVRLQVLPEIGDIAKNNAAFDRIRALYDELNSSEK